MLKVVVGHKTRPTTLLISTPIRKESVKRIARRSYPSLISELAKSSAVYRKLMIKAVTKHTKKEMRSYPEIIPIPSSQPSRRRIS